MFFRYSIYVYLFCPKKKVFGPTPSDGLNLQFSGPIGPFTKCLKTFGIAEIGQHNPVFFLVRFGGVLVLVLMVGTVYFPGKVGTSTVLTSLPKMPQNFTIN